MAVGAFVALGMPELAFSVAWPGVAEEMGRTIGDLGIVLLVHSLGFGVVAALTGRLILRFGVAPLVGWAALVNALSLLGAAAAPGFGTLLAVMALLGATGGVLDAGINTYTALEMDARALNFVHSGFGVGAALGPWIMTVAVVSAGWELGMAVMSVIMAAAAGAFWRTRRIWQIREHEDAHGPRGDGRGARTDLVLLVLMLAVFILYTGGEVGTGSWAFSLLSEGRGIGTGLAGLAAGGFWAALTISRMVMGVAGGRWEERRVVAVCGAGTIGGLVLLWWAPAAWVGIAGLLLSGLAFGPLFPLHTSLTAARVGRRAAQSIIGLQLAAAVSGGALVPWVIGRAVDAAGLETIGPLLVVTVVGMVVVDRVLDRLVRRRPPPPA